MSFNNVDVTVALFLSAAVRKLLAISKASPSISNIPAGTLTNVSPLRNPLLKVSKLIVFIFNSFLATSSSLSLIVGFSLLS